MLLVGMLAAVSRTGIVIGVMFLFALVFRPKLAGLLFVFALPILIVGRSCCRSLNELIGSLLDVDSLIASQFTSPGWPGAGAWPISPAIRESASNPLGGTGLGSRIVVGDEANA